MRFTRPKYSELSDDQKLKAIARSMARIALRRGQIKRSPCEVCGAIAQMHHDDYSRPLYIRWFCRRHHLELHKNGLYNTSPHI